MNNNVVDALKQLKEQINNGRVSALIGSGFSKNVSDVFPNWMELLEDMAFELYEEDINIQITNLEKKLNAGEDYEKEKTRRVRAMITKIGYLVEKPLNLTTLLRFKLTTCAGVK